MLLYFYSFLGLVFLVLLHEFSHFLAAKKSKIKVLEFGVFLPPRILKIKKGETIYSLNLIPLGGFVRLEGEEKESQKEGSFSQAKLSQRIFVVLAGVLSFWIICAILFSLIFAIGIRLPISEDEKAKDPKIEILYVLKDSPAQKIDLKEGDFVLGVKFEGKYYKIEKAKDLREMTENLKGKEIILEIERKNEILEKRVLLEKEHPSDRGPLGIVISRTDFKKVSPFLAPFYGIKETGKLTLQVLEGYISLISNLVSGKKVEAKLTGPVGIFYLGKEALNQGIIYYLFFLAQISIFLAIFNALPIPGLDGGKFLFLAIEGIFKKKVRQDLQVKIEGIFVILLIFLVILATYSDIKIFFAK